MEVIVKVKKGHSDVLKDFEKIKFPERELKEITVNKNVARYIYRNNKTGIDYTERFDIKDVVDEIRIKF